MGRPSLSHRRGTEITIAEIQPELARKAHFVYWKHILKVIAAEGEEKQLTTDTVLIATGMKANNGMLDDRLLFRIYGLSDTVSTPPEKWKR